MTAGSQFPFVQINFPLQSPFPVLWNVRIRVNRFQKLRCAVLFRFSILCVRVETNCKSLYLYHPREEGGSGSGEGWKQIASERSHKSRRTECAAKGLCNALNRKAALSMGGIGPPMLGCNISFQSQVRRKAWSFLRSRTFETSVKQWGCQEGAEVHGVQTRTETQLAWPRPKTMAVWKKTHCSSASASFHDTGNPSPSSPCAETQHAHRMGGEKIRGHVCTPGCWNMLSPHSGGGLLLLCVWKGHLFAISLIHKHLLSTD